MAFNNNTNRVNLKGYVLSDVEQTNEYSVEFQIAVPRKAAPGAKVYSDIFTVYVNNSAVCTFCKEHLKKSVTITVKGELRNFYNGDIKICSDDIQLSSKKK